MPCASIQKNIIVSGYETNPTSKILHIFKEVDKYLDFFKDHPYVFNLGHGLLPETNPDIVQKVIERVKKFK